MLSGTLEALRSRAIFSPRLKLRKKVILFPTASSTYPQASSGHLVTKERSLVYVSCRDRDLINKCGDDARIYIMFQYHLIIYVLILCIPSLGIILPINYVGTVLGRQCSAGRWYP